MQAAPHSHQPPDTDPDGSPGGTPPTDWTRFWRVPDSYSAEFLHASFTNHAYDRHTHDRYVFGVTTGGAEQFWHRGAMQVAPAGRVVVVNPGDVHDGESVEPGQCWNRRICYLDPALFEAVAAEDHTTGGMPLFTVSVLDDPPLARALCQFHTATENGDLSALERDTRLRGLVATLIRRYATHRPTPAAAAHEPDAIRRTRDYLDAHYADDISLADLGARVGLSPLYLARTFRKAVGAPPHAYHIIKRIEAASVLLRQNHPLADVAAACGFADQSHMTRQFRRVHGITPGAYRQATPAPFP